MIRGDKNTANGQCEFAMSGGVIEGNSINVTANSLTANARGGGVYRNNDSVFNFSGGIIRDNHCSAVSVGEWGFSAGGGIMADDASVNMSGGIVNGNTTKHKEALIYSMKNRTKVRNQRCPNNITEVYLGLHIFGAWAGGVYVADHSDPDAHFKKTEGISRQRL